jgi:hypothetical protein
LLSYAPLVKLLEREAWEAYAQEHQTWIQDGQDFHSSQMTRALSTNLVDPAPAQVPNISESIFYYNAEGNPAVEKSKGPFLPIWQIAPVPSNPQMINLNLLSHPVYSLLYQGLMDTGLPVLSGVTDLPSLHQTYLETEDDDRDHSHHPHSALLQPIHAAFIENTAVEQEEENPVVGVVSVVLSWDHYFVDLMPEEAVGLIVVVQSTCGDVFTYQVDGNDASFLGYSDFHDTAYDDLVLHAPFSPFLDFKNHSDSINHCEFDMYMYPSRDLEERFMTAQPIMHTVVVVLVFFLTTMVFVLYDFFVQQRQEEAEATAKRSNAIVSSLFPKHVQKQMMREAEEHEKAQAASKQRGLKRFVAPKSQLKDYLSVEQQKCQLEASSGIGLVDKPMADLFPSATVMYVTPYCMSRLVYSDSYGSLPLFLTFISFQRFPSKVCIYCRFYR